MNDAAAEGADGHGWMSGETSGGGSKRKRGTVMTAVVVVAAVAIAVLELFVLEGEEVFDARLDARREVQVEIPLDRAGEPHHRHERMLGAEARRDEEAQAFGEGGHGRSPGPGERAGKRTGSPAQSPARPRARPRER